MSRINTLARVLLLAVFVLSLFGSDCFARSAEEIAKLKAEAQEAVPKIEAAAPVKPAVQPLRERKLLVINLCNGFYHESIPYWDKTVEIMGTKTGAWQTTVSSDMAMFKRENLHKFDAVCFNNTTKLKFDDEEMKKSLMDFINNGKGIIGIHGASDNFYDWPEAAELMGGQFTGHPWTSGGTWAIKLDDPDHPLMAAFGGENFKLKEEIYRTDAPLYSRAKQRVLMSLDMSDEATGGVKDLKPSDQDTGISWIKNKGRGRLFYCSIGHNPEHCWNPAILQHYVVGIQFALGDMLVDATPLQQRPVDDILAEVKDYEYGKSRLALTELTDLIRNAGKSREKLGRIEQALLKFLKSDATAQSKQFACRQLSIIGTEASVPTLAAMLTEKSSAVIQPADMARYALERIPGAKVDQALRDALDKTEGAAKIGIMNSIGARRDDAAAKRLGELAANSDEQIATAAISALGKIGTENAARALKDARANLDKNLSSTWADAYMLCADKLAESGPAATAFGAYNVLYADKTQPDVIRIAALRGMVAANPNKGSALIANALKAKDQTMQTAAISLLRDIPKTTISTGMTELMPELSAQSQIQMLAVLADRDEISAMSAVLTAAKSHKVAVRIAALETLGTLGDSSHIQLLAQTAATTQGKEQQAARQALYRLSAMAVDARIMAGIADAEPDIKIELIRAVAERNAVIAGMTLLQQASDTEADVRIEALKAITVLADERYMHGIIQYLKEVKNDTDRAEAENAMAATARKIKDENRRTRHILAALDAAQDTQTRSSFLRVLGKVGGAQALEANTKALADSDSEVKLTAVRVLAEWPNAEPMDSMRKVANESTDQRQKVLALRGFVRMIGQAKLSPDEKLAMYEEAMSLAPNPSEKRPILSGLGGVRTPDSLKIVSSYLDDSALQQEAAAAAIAIAESIREAHPQQAKTAAQKILQVTKNDSVKERAQRIIDQVK